MWKSMQNSLKVLNKMLSEILSFYIFIMIVWWISSGNLFFVHKHFLSVGKIDFNEEKKNSSFIAQALC